jgi:hypothetical protein
MMLAYRLVRLIETHADELAQGLAKKVRDDPRVASFQEIPAEELKERVYEIYRHLGEWLMGSSEHDIERRYREIGMRRAKQGVPLVQLIQAIVLTKENLWEFLKSEVILDRAVEILGELELLQMLEMFFDRAIYYAALGYEEQVARTGQDLGSLRAN